LIKLEEIVDEINVLYNKATRETDYLEVEEKAASLEKEMIETGKSIKETAKAIMNGFWASYYLARKFNRINSLLFSNVKSYYSQIEDPELKIAYGCLLAVISSELREDFATAKEINSEIQKVAEETENVVSILRVINARGLKEMKEKNFAGAIKIFNEVEQIIVPTEASQHMGNILSNLGISKIRGEIDILDGISDLIEAASHYLETKPIPLKHIEGIKNRLNEAGEKLVELAKKSEPSS